MSDVQIRVRVAGEQYSLSVDDVVEVADLGDVSPVPGAPAEILGVRNLRGQVIPVLDLATVFGISSDTVPERIVIAEQGDQRAGLAVDQVLDVGVMPEVSHETDSRYLAGAALVDGSLVGVVDVEAVLGSREQR